MDPGSSIQLMVLLFLLYLSSFFSSAETAFTSLSRVRIRQMLDDEVKNAKIVEILLSKPNKLLSTILIGNNLVNIAATSLATSVAIEQFNSYGVGIATGAMTFMILVFGEITPKSIALQRKEKICLRAAKPMYVMSVLLDPFIKLFTVITNFTITLRGGIPSKDQPHITEDELRTMVTMSEEEGVLEAEEKEMIHNVFEFRNSLVKEIMIPRTDVIAVDIDISYEDLREFISNEQFSRIPVYNDTFDDVLGILHIKDFFLKCDKDNFNLMSLLREPYYVFEYKQVDELLKEMQKERIHLAMVVDEYGGTAGIITMEDLIEEIIGNIEDEYDEVCEQEFLEVSESEFLIDGGYHIDDVNNMLDLSLPSDEYDTIAGFLLKELGHIPEEGEALEYNNLTFSIETMSKNRIERIRLIINNDTEMPATQE